jgi:NADPH:quinone reductase-like Zn-dependent oxidoreductase
LIAVSRSAIRSKDRFGTTECSVVMQAVVTTGNVGFDKLVYREVPIPVAGPGEVLVRVLAAGMNNTDVNTRLGWYSGGLSAETGGQSKPEDGQLPVKGWNEITPFPLIQRTDCCGQVVAAGESVWWSTTSPETVAGT